MPRPWHVHADTLDGRLLAIFGDTYRDFDYDALGSEEKKFLLHAALEHDPAYPLFPLFPLRLASLIRFVFWLPTANVTGGWKSCKI
eukprot:SAG11_NODE_7261_length_1169_cov_6.968224_1_plen_86_part_00